jgi:excisionase family DNA binding protein
VTGPSDGLLTIDEAAALLRMSKTTFRRRLDRGEISVIRDRRHVLVARSALVDYLERHTIAHHTPGRPAASHARRTSPAAVTARRVGHLWEADA